MKLKVKYASMPVFTPSWDYIIQFVEPIETAPHFISISFCDGVKLKRELGIIIGVNFSEEKKQLLINYLPKYWNNLSGVEPFGLEDSVELIECNLLSPKGE